MTTTPNMGLVLPTDHGSADVWDTILDALFALIDSHNHTPGRGVKVPTAGLNIDADLSFAPGGSANARAITDLKAIDFSPTASTGVTALAGAFFVSDGTGGLVSGELYYRTVLGSNVQVTLGAALNVAAFGGGIGGDYISASALLSYDAASTSYWLQQPGAPRPWARIHVGDVDIYETAASIVKRVRLKSPAALAADYDVTWPAAVPGSTVLMQMSSAGVMSVSNTIANAVTLSATLGAAAITSAAITASGLITANAGVTAGANQNVTVSGTGDIKHGSRTIAVSAAAFTAGNNFSAATLQLGAGTPEWAMGGAPPNDTIGGDVPLRAGDRITAMTWHFNKNSSAAAMTFTLNTRNGTTITARDSFNDVSSGAAYTSTTRGSVNYTLASGDATTMVVQSSNSVHRFSHCVITYDHP